jgi:putative MATE family efflux protein
MRDTETSPTLPSTALGSQAVGEPEIDPRLTDREILALGWPVVLGLMIINAVQLVDIFMLSRLGTDTLAAVGYGTQFFLLVQAMVLSAGAACVALMARALGAGREELARKALAATLWLSTGCTTTIALLAVAAPRFLLGLLDVQPSVVELAVPYLRLTLGASVLFGVSMMLEHAFRAAKNTVIPMRIAAMVGAVKLLFNFLLIFGVLGFPRLELVGAGLATLISQAVGMTLMIAASRGFPGQALRLRPRDFRVPRSILQEAVRLSLPAMGERLLMNTAVLVYFRFLGSYGVAAVAAYNVGVRLLSFSWLPGLGLSVAAATLVGRALGASDPRQARRSGWRAARISLLVSIVLGSCFILAREPLAGLFAEDPEVTSALVPFILMLAISQPFLGLQFTLGGALRGAGDTVTPFKAVTLGTWGLRVPLGYLFTRLLLLDLVWVWSIMIFDHFARSAWMVWSFRYGSWQKRLGVSPGSSAVSALAEPATHPKPRCGSSPGDG